MSRASLWSQHHRNKSRKVLNRRHFCCMEGLCVRKFYKEKTTLLIMVYRLLVYCPHILIFKHVFIVQYIFMLKQIFQFANSVAVSSRHMLVWPQTDLTFRTTQLPPAVLKVATDVVCGVIPCSCHCSCPTTPPLLGHWWGQPSCGGVANRLVISSHLEMNSI